VGTGFDNKEKQWKTSSTRGARVILELEELKNPKCLPIGWGIELPSRFFDLDLGKFNPPEGVIFDLKKKKKKKKRKVPPPAHGKARAPQGGRSLGGGRWRDATEKPAPDFAKNA
jgi:hypothetical protein